MTTTRDEDIYLESGEYVPVGRMWKFYLDFGDKSNFCHVQISRDSVMLKFLATIEGEKKLSEITNVNLIFANLPESSIRVELSCSRQIILRVPAKVSSLGKREP